MIGNACLHWITLRANLHDSRGWQSPPKTSAVIDTRVIYCGDNLDQLRKLPEGCVDLIYIDPPFNSNRNPVVHLVKFSRRQLLLRLTVAR